MKLTPSPFTPKELPTMPEIAGVQLAAVETGYKYQNRPDLLLVKCAEGTSMACVTTASLTPSSAVEICRAHSRGGKARVLLVNAGNANAFTGQVGKATTAEILNVCALLTGVSYAQTLMCSTGVIGKLLPAESIVSHLAELNKQLKPTGWLRAAQAIMTTDTYPKCATRSFTIGGAEYTINGIAKGSGMIAPNMATMLAFMFTDAPIEPLALQRIFQRCNAKSFNAITVDGDTSTSDTALIFATGAKGGKPFRHESELIAFEKTLLDLMQDLAKQVVMDGEGAQKLITVNVTGAKSDDAAHRIAMSIANSPLVKTAIAGADANWGRVVMAVGKAGEEVVRDKLTISFGGQIAAQHGQLNPAYDEAVATEHVSSRNVEVSVDIGIGKGRATVWTCDLTHGYIDINGSYRT